MSRLNCVILAAGKGTRMVSKIPKIAHPIMGKPMIRFVVERARELDADKIIVVTGHESEIVRNCLKEDKVAFCLQAEQKGTAHALLTTESELVKGDILILYGDVPLMTTETLVALRESFHHSEGISFMTTEVADPKGYGRIITDENSDIIDIVEDSDATGSVRDIRIINTGICMIRSGLLPLVKEITPNNKKGEYYLTDICKVAGGKGIKVKAYFHPNASEVLGINTRKELLDANVIMRNRILDRHMEHGVTIADRSVYIESDVTIGKDTTILPYSFISGRTSIGEDAVVGPHAFIKDSAIADGAVVGPFSVYRNGIIERA
jgi:bifunctional UDP-N-acetylglucosamine pyrophosphorylase / glucosamine-1-phosphate N-acetyltransferase